MQASKYSNRTKSKLGMIENDVVVDKETYQRLVINLFICLIHDHIAFIVNVNLCITQKKLVYK